MSKPLRHPLHLLVLECDANTLASQGLSFFDEIQLVTKLLPDKARCEMERINSQEQFTATVRRYFENYSSVHNILIIGHSNPGSIRIAQGFDQTWGAVGQWIKPLKTQRLALVACEAGKFASCRAMFNEAPSLRKIYASPFKGNKKQFRGILFILGFLLWSKTVTPNHILGAQIGSFWSSGGVILECSRRNPELTELVQSWSNSPTVDHLLNNLRDWLR